MPRHDVVFSVDGHVVSTSAPSVAAETSACVSDGPEPTCWRLETDRFFITQKVMRAAVYYRDGS